jgi:hypothetical protein
MESHDISSPSFDWNSVVRHVVKDQVSVELVQDSKAIAVINPIKKPVLMRDLNAVMAKAPRLAPGDAEEYLKDIREALEQLPPETDPWEF